MPFISFPFHFWLQYPNHWCILWKICLNMHVYHKKHDHDAIIVDCNTAVTCGYDMCLVWWCLIAINISLPWSWSVQVVTSQAIYIIKIAFNSPTSCFCKLKVSFPERRLLELCLTLFTWYSVMSSKNSNPMSIVTFANEHKLMCGKTYCNAAAKMNIANWL